MLDADCRQWIERAGGSPTRGPIREREFGPDGFYFPPLPLTYLLVHSTSTQLSIPLFPTPGPSILSPRYTSRVRFFSFTFLSPLSSQNPLNAPCSSSATTRDPALPSRKYSLVRAHSLFCCYPSFLFQRSHTFTPRKAPACMHTHGFNQCVRDFCKYEDNRTLTNINDVKRECMFFA